jgi:hypothetical protein
MNAEQPLSGAATMDTAKILNETMSPMVSNCQRSRRFGSAIGMPGRLLLLILLELINVNSSSAGPNGPMGRSVAVMVVNP